MVLSSAGAVMSGLIGLRRKSAPIPVIGGRPTPEENYSTPSTLVEPIAISSATPGSTSSSGTSMKLVMVIFWTGVTVGVVVSGLAAWRLYTMSMAEREEWMVKQLLQQETRMEQEKQDRFWLGLAMASVISVLAVIQSYRMKMAEREACAKNQQRLKSLLIERMTKKEVGPPPEEEVVERLQCVVCLGARREVILLDCGHVCACRICADTLLREDHLCPVCRADIRTIKPAFIS